MKTLLSMGFVCLLSAHGFATTIEKAAKANNEFGFEFYKAIKRHENKGTENRLVSPVSGYFALAMTSNGAQGATEEAIRKTIAASSLTREELNTANQTLLKSLNGKHEVKLVLANSLWTDDGFGMIEDFRSRVQSTYDAEARELDLQQPGTADVINDWVMDKTNGKIRDLVKDPIQETFFIINATYFKGAWRYPFSESNTSDDNFYTASGTKRVPTMHGNFIGRYVKASGYEVVELSYGAMNEASMLLFVPENLSELESNLSNELWEGVSKKLADPDQTRIVKLALPKFEFKYASNLVQPLSEMGMEVAFSPMANFFDMVRSPIQLTKALQKTFIKLDEKGTEAAAATVIGGTTSAPAFKHVTVNADRPFLVAIRDNATNAVLFIGAVGQP